MKSRDGQSQREEKRREEKRREEKRREEKRREEKRREEKRREEKRREEKRREEKRREEKRREEKRREEKRREEKRREDQRNRREKSQKKEDTGARNVKKSRETLRFPVICGLARSKTRLAKATGAAKWEMKNCTPLRREAHVQVEMHKNIPLSDHFWKIRCRKNCKPLRADRSRSRKRYRQIDRHIGN